MSLSIILPLKMWTNGFASFDDSETKIAIHQNLKMLLLTRPGEYMMDAEFGVGITNYLFEHQGSSITNRITARINDQVAKYMPYIAIQNVHYNLENFENNALGLTIEYLTSEDQLPQIFNLDVVL